MWQVRVYLQDLAYGGAEEGGWWYEYGEAADEVSAPRTFSERYQAFNYANALNAGILAELNEDRPAISSVLSRGRYTAQTHEGDAPDFYPENKPHYE